MGLRSMAGHFPRCLSNHRSEINRGLASADCQRTFVYSWFPGGDGSSLTGRVALDDSENRGWIEGVP